MGPINANYLNDKNNIEFNEYKRCDEFIKVLMKCENICLNSTKSQLWNSVNYITNINY